MLNLVTVDISDRSILENSYNSLKNKENVEIITNDSEKDIVFRKVIDNIKIPKDSHFAFQNLFKVNSPSGYFYIAQCFVDFGYPIGTKGTQSFSPKYSFQIIGIADLKIDLGITHLRPENRIDKFLSRFFSNDIDFENAEIFNNKYYLVSDNKNAVLKYFNNSFLSSIAKHDGILLTTSGNQMFISFDQELEVSQTRIVQDIFSSFKFLTGK